MDRNERSPDSVETFRIAFQGAQSQMWTALPGIIDSVDFNGDMPGTVNVQPAIAIEIRNPDGSTSATRLPLLLDCPVIFPSGGGFTLTFPIAAGDECLVILAARCIDNWYDLGGVQGEAEFRLHDLSDGFCLVGPRSKARELPAISATNVELRSDAGTAVISIRDNSEVYVHSDASVIIDADGDVSVQAGGDVNVTAGGDLVANVAGDAAVTAPTIHLTGAVTITGDLIVTGQTNTGGLDVSLNANFHGAIVDVTTGKDIGGAHTHPYDGHSSGSYTTGGVV